MRKLIIFSLITAMSFSLFGCEAVTSTTSEIPTDTISDNQAETTTEEPTTVEPTTEEPTTEEPTTEEPTTEALLDDGKMSEYVAAAQKAYDAFIADYYADYEFEPNISLAFCDINFDNIPEFFILRPYANLQDFGPLYKYIDGEFISSCDVIGYYDMEAYINSEGNVRLLYAREQYDTVDYRDGYEFSDYVDMYDHYCLDLSDNAFYCYGHSIIPRKNNKIDAPRYYNANNEAISKDEFNVALNALIGSYTKKELKKGNWAYGKSGSDQTEPLSTAYSNYLKAISK